MTCSTLLLGWVGLVIEVGLENDGLTRSIRRPAGAIWRHPLPFSGLTQLGPGGIDAGAGVAGVARPGGALGLPHAPAVRTTAARLRQSSADPGRSPDWSPWRGMPSSWWWERPAWVAAGE